MPKGTHSKQKEMMKLSLWYLIHCSLVYSSGVFAGIDTSQSLYDRYQLTSEVAGFLTPNLFSDFTLSEVEDLMPVLAPVLTPIYRAIVILRYPTKQIGNSKHLHPQEQKAAQLPTNGGTRFIPIGASNLHHNKIRSPARTSKLGRIATRHLRNANPL